ncbi:MAG: MFS transporter, partial [Dactylosporangium sp.]|nr:MFS transporter [Dactylosporangium sp.]NNJ60095.1 MFS transporter [Dactylosporangium sp.]
MLVVSLLVVVLDNTVLNVALRVIADPVRGLGASQSELEWAINAYTLTFAGLLFTWGVLADRAGRRRILLIGLTLFGLASLASTWAQTPGHLILARAAMGIGGAGVLPATLSIISDVFDPSERARAIGVWAGTVGLATAIGPVVGGWLLEHFWWGSIFLINVPIVVVGMVAILAVVPESRDPRPGRIDIVGVLLSVVGLVSLVYGIVDGGEHGFLRAQALAPMAAGIAVLALFIAYERRLTFPALDVRLFANSAFSAAVSALGLAFFAAMGTMFFVSFYLQTVRGYSPLNAGMMLLPFAGAQLLFAPRSAAAVRRFGARTVCSTGMALVATALIGMAFIDATTPIWAIGVIFFVQGAGMANVMPPATTTALAALPAEKAGVGSAINNTIRQVGGALGVAVLGSLLSSVYRDRLGPEITNLPAAVRTVASESIAGAYGAAERLGPAGDALSGAADDAFLSAMHLVALAAATVAVIGAVVVGRWLPGRERRSSGPSRTDDPST